MKPLENNRAELLRKAYWSAKLKDSVILTTRDNVDVEVIDFEIKDQDLTAFKQITSGAELTEYTILIGLYSFLIKTYFSDSFDGLILSTSNIQPLLNPFILKCSDQVKDKTWKDWLREMAQEVEAVSAYIETADNTLTPYGAFGFTYSKTAIEETIAKRLYVEILKKEDGCLHCSFSYDKTFFPTFLIESFAKCFKNILLNIKDTLGLSLMDTPLLNSAERQEVLVEFNNTAQTYAKEKTLTALFENQAIKTPQDIALIFETNTLTFQELNEQSNQLAHYLINAKEVKSNDLVGIKLERNEQLIITILAVLKTGAAYVPIDLNYPEQRIEYIEQDSGCELVIDQTLLNHFHTEVDQPSTNPQRNTQADDLAYIIYTSGSTGKPKGVMIMHGSAFEMVQWAKQEFDATKFETTYATTSHCFDLSIYEIFYTLSEGKQLRILRNALEIETYLVEDQKVLLNTVPSVARKLLEDGVYNTDRISILNLAGEAFPIDIVAQLEPHKVDVRNLYGPSEDTTYSTYYQLKNQTYQDIPIGKPITNTQAYILNDSLQPVPVGVVGKLYLGGAGVAKGYLNRPELTLERFIANPFMDGAKMYNTGDLAKWMPDGNLSFLGRQDDQVKLRGYRIELGEIDNAIGLFSKEIVQAVTVVLNYKGETVLAAYYQEQGRINKSNLRDFLVEKLPGYMLPTYFVRIEQIPLTPNGKIDKKALPAIGAADLIKSEYAAPTDATEKALVDIWEEVLGVSPIGINDYFFELGGHSLMISQIINAIYKKLDHSVAYKVFYTNPSISDLRKALKHKAYLPIPKAAESEGYPLTPAQHRMWVLSQFSGATLAYNMPFAIEISGALEISLLEESFKILIAEHETFRTYFKMNEEGEVLQHVRPSEEINFEFTRVEFNTKGNKQALIQAFLEEKSKGGFDLEQAPLVTASIIRLNKTKHIFFINKHHIIGDGWSSQLTISEVEKNYNALLNKETVTASPASVQYKDYAVWLNSSLQVEKQKASEEYWLEQFSGELPVLSLPSFKTRPTTQTYYGATIKRSYSHTFLEKLKAFSKAQGATIFMSLMAGINVLFHRYTDQEDIILGTPIAGRDHPDLEDKLGLFLNTLAIRTKIEKGQNFLDLLAAEKMTLLEAYENQTYPFDALVSKLNLERDPSRSPLFDVMVVLQSQEQLNNFRNGGQLTGLELKEMEFEKGTAQFDLALTFVESEGLDLEIEYNTDIYDHAWVEKIFAHLENLLNGLMGNPALAIRQVAYLTAAEEQELSEDFNKTEKVYPQDKTVIELFEAQVLETPDALALIFENQKWTYRTLNKEANLLANHLITQHKVGREDLVAMKLERGAWQVISMLGILKAGAAYLPIEIDTPEDRTLFMIQDSNCKLMIDAKELVWFEKTKTNYKKSNPNIIRQLQDLIYVLYTSGTTGHPKGVMIEQRNVVNLIHWFAESFKLSSTTQALQLTDYSFDPSVEDIFGTLCFGGTYHAISKTTLLNIDSLRAYISNHEITLLNYVPKHLDHLLSNRPKLESIQYVISGGEKLPENVKESILAVGYDLYNNYGPTEITVDALSGRMGEEPVNIGKPVANAQVYVLDEFQKMVPVGVSGQLYVGGEGVARGYLNRPALTAEKFIRNSGTNENLRYHTGDVCRWLPDGSIEFVGRQDTQVKIRGHRVELGEIEYKILQYSTHLKEVVVMVQEIEQEPVLVTYYTSSLSIEKAALRKSLSEQLPDYMIPTYFVNVESIPLTSNGKTDWDALPEVDESDLVRKEYLAPTTKEEKTLVTIWQTVLGIEEIGLSDNFFDLGGHSLIVAQVINKTQQELRKTISFQDFFSDPTIKGLSSRLKKSDYSSIPNAPEAATYPLTAAQNRMWVLSQLEGGSLAYNMLSAISLRGDLKDELLELAFIKLINRHEILRTSFHADEEGIISQRIANKETITFKLDRLDYTRKSDQVASVNQYIEKQKKTAFDLEASPLLRGTLIKLGEEEHLFFITIHHVISDGWSIEILISEIVETYNALCEGQNTTLPILDIQYKDYAVWLNGRSNVEQQKVAETYWLTQLEGELPTLELPGYQARPKVKTYHGATCQYSYSEDFLNRLKAFSKAHDATLFMTLMAGVNALLYRYTNQDDLIIGTPIAGRDHPDLEHQLGLFLNTLAIRTRLTKDQRFSDVLIAEKKTLLEAYEHQSYPFDELVQQLDLKKDTSRSALFDVMVVLQNQEQLHNISQRKDLKDLVIEDYDFAINTAQFDIRFTFVETEGLTLELEYNTDIYEESMMLRLLTHFENFLSTALDQPEAIILDLNFLNEAEQTHLTEDHNDTFVAYPQTESILEAFAQQVEMHPDQIIARYEDQEISVRTLEERSNQLANYLRIAGVEKEELIPICIDRSLEMLIGVLAILKAGGAYVPLDPHYPKQRIDFILQDVTARFVLTNSALLSSFSSLEIIDLETFDYGRYSNDPMVEKTLANQLAYVIYTSGTTGNPKGVLNEHGALLNRLFWMRDDLNINKDSIIAQKTTYTFDVSVWELMMPLLTGCRLIFAIPDGHKDPVYLQDWIAQNGISIIHFVPSMLGEFLRSVDVSKCKSLKHVVCSGEALPVAMVHSFKKQLPEVELHNFYGPTEAAIDVTSIALRKIETNQIISIGKPVANTQIYIVNEQQQLQPIGMIGELLIGGVQVARGYLNRPDLTAEKFIKNSFQQNKSETLYRTGDLARWLPDGNIEFLGRNDHQVKIRGNRVELSEIERIIEQYSEDLTQVIVQVKTIHEEQKIVAYCVVPHLEKTGLSTYLQAHLPAYMIPDYFVELDKMPLTANGKLDRKSLPEVVEEDLIRRTYVAPRNETENGLVEIWESVLKVTRISVLDDFFELGGDSIVAIRVVSRVNKAFETKLRVGDLYQKSDIASLAEWIEQGEIKTPSLTKLQKEMIKSVQLIRAEVMAADNPDVEDAYPMSDIQKGMVYSSILNQESSVYHDQLIFQIPKVDTNTFKTALSLMVEKHATLRTRFDFDTYSEPVQLVHKQVDVTIDFEDLKALVWNEQETIIKKYMSDELRRPFDFKAVPLWRFGIFEINETSSIFVFQFYHAILDGWSVASFNVELFSIYKALQKDANYRPKALSSNYRDAITEELLEKYNDQSIDFWKQQLSGYERLEIFSSQEINEVYNQKYSAAELKQLRKRGREDQVSLKTVLMGAYIYALNMLSYKDDVVIGLVMNNRPEIEDGDKLLGCFLNTLPMRTQLSHYAKTTWSDFVMDMEKQTKALQNYKGLTLFEISRLLDEPTQDGNPFFDVLFNFIDFHIYNDIKSDLEETEIVQPTFEIESFERTNTYLDLTLNVEKEELHFNYKLSRRLLSDLDLSNLHQYIDGFLKNYIHTPNQIISKDALIPAEEKKQLLHGFNNTQADYPKTKTIAELFSEQVKVSPTTIALIDREGELSYQGLEDLATQYATYLYHELNVRQGDRIVLVLEHNNHLMAAFLAVKKLGAVYVGVDPKTPVDRIDFIQKDSNSIARIDAVVLAEMSKYQASPDALTMPDVNENQEESAFIIYTSGSTGLPKGTLIKSSSVMNRLHWMWENYPFESGEVCCAKTSISFVDHIWELYGPLLQGVPLVFYKKEEILQIPQFIKSLQDNAVSRIVLVPSLLKEMLAYPDLCRDQLQSLRICISSGEALRRSEVEQFYNTMRRGDVRLLNIYGSTEVTADATYFDTYSEYNKFKNFPLFDYSLKNELDELIDQHDESDRIISSTFQELLEKEDFHNVNPDAQTTKTEYLAFLENEVMPNVVNVGNSSFVGHITSPIPKIIRELNGLVVAINQNQVKIETSMVATLIERQVIGIFHNLVYGRNTEFYTEFVQHPDHSLGVITNGGTMSNIMAMSYALNHLLKPKEGFDGIRREGLINALKAYDYEKVVLLGSAWCHYSFEKTLRLLGLGTNAFVELDFEGKEDGQIELELKELITQLRKEKTLILGMIGIAGTTESGNIDPLALLGKIAKEHDVFYHVDAAFGGSFLMDDEIRKKLKGIELADSVAVCAHKQLYIPLGLSICVFKDPSLVLSSETNSQYQARKGSYDLGKFTIEGSKKFMSLLLHAAFRIFGKEGFAQVISHNYNTAQLFAKLVDDNPDFELLYQPDLNIVLYRYVPVYLREQVSFSDEELETINALNLKIQKEQFKRGNTFVSYTSIARRGNEVRHLVFRTVFMNPYTTKKDLEMMLEEQKMIAAQIQKRPYQEIVLSENISIGKPIENVKVYILDDALDILPMGVIGEICIAGDGVSSGYIQTNEQTAEKFTDNPFHEGERLFRTGDLGRWTADGNIELVGRKDNQVKIRGHRIELGELENTLLNKESISQAVVKVVSYESSGEQELAAYFVSSDQETVEDLIAVLRTQLPDYMLPTYFVQLEKLPLNVNGKIDKRVLPDPRKSGVASKIEYVAPKNEIEEKLVAIWESVLEKQSIGIRDDFFALGGHSIKATKVMSMINKEFSVDINIRNLFNASTIEDLAAQVSFVVKQKKTKSEISKLKEIEL